MNDVIDEMIDRWQQELPQLDATPLHLVGRVIVLAQHLQKSVDQALAIHKLNLGLFDILATLRREGPRGRMTPTSLSHKVMLSTGGMTNRLDRLEEMGWIERLPDPSDRRGTLVALTAKGCKLIETATATRFQEAAHSLPPLDEKEKEILAKLLRKWLANMKSQSMS